MASDVESLNVYRRITDSVWMLTCKHGDVVESVELYRFVGHPVTNVNEAEQAAKQWLDKHGVSSELLKLSAPQEERQAEQPQGDEDMAEAVKTAKPRKPRVRKAVKKTAKKTTKPKVRKMSDSHKAALAEGRNHARIVNVYLTALDANKPKRGRKRTAETVQSQLDKVEKELTNGTGGVTQLSLVQQRRDLTVELAGLVGNGGPSIEEAQTAFVKVAKAFSAQRGISYGAWREVGVPADVLKAAGITRSKSE